MTRSVYRYSVPIDDKWHEFSINGKILHIAQRDDIEIVEFWAIFDQKAQPVKRQLRVFGTGHLLPVEAKFYYGSVLAPPRGLLVWHVFGRDVPDDEV